METRRQKRPLLPKLLYSLIGVMLCALLGVQHRHNSQLIKHELVYLYTFITSALFTLGGEHALVEAEVLRRPSQRNRSPYVADIRVAGREAICHVLSCVEITQ